MLSENEELLLNILEIQFKLLTKTTKVMKEKFETNQNSNVNLTDREQCAELLKTSTVYAERLWENITICMKTEGVIDDDVWDDLMKARRALMEVEDYMFKAELKFMN